MKVSNQRKTEIDSNEKFYITIKFVKFENNINKTN